VVSWTGPGNAALCVRPMQNNACPRPHLDLAFLFWSPGSSSGDRGSRTIDSERRIANIFLHWFLTETFPCLKDTSKQTDGLAPPIFFTIGGKNSPTHSPLKPRELAPPWKLVPIQNMRFWSVPTSRVIQMAPPHKHMFFLLFERPQERILPRVFNGCRSLWRRPPATAGGEPSLHVPAPNSPNLLLSSHASPFSASSPLPNTAGLHRIPTSPNSSCSLPHATSPAPHSPLFGPLSTGDTYPPSPPPDGESYIRKESQTKKDFQTKTNYSTYNINI